MRVMIATDAWEPQINGVVRTLQSLRDHALDVGLELSFITPSQFRTVAMPGYPEIRLALATTASLIAQIREFAPDVVHVATEGPIGLAARNACLYCDVPLTTSYHTRFPEYLSARLPVPERITYALLRRFHGAADGILVSTPSLEAELAARGFGRLMRWSRGVDLSQYYPRGASLIDLPRPIFLNVGRIAVEKNLEAFLELDLPGTKMIVGDGPQRAMLQARYPQAVFTGSKVGAELAELYRQADVFVFPSRTDTFGVVILEALASGLPVAAFPVMGPRDIIEGSAAGFLSEDLRQASLDCLMLSSSKCTDLASRYGWRASAQQFRDNLAAAMACSAQRQRRTAA